MSIAVGVVGAGGTGSFSLSLSSDAGTGPGSGIPDGGTPPPTGGGGVGVLEGGISHHAVTPVMPMTPAPHFAMRPTVDWYKPCHVADEGGVYALGVKLI